MRRKLILTYIIIITLMCLIIGYISIYTSQKYLENQIEESLIRELNLISDILEQTKDYNPLEFVNHYSEKMSLRLTLIDNDGNVIADSDKESDKLDNHSQRDEFKKAKLGEISFIKRYSETMGTFYLYCAKAINYNSNNTIIRISTPLLKVQNLKTDILNLNMIGIIVGLVISIIVAFIFSKIFSASIYQFTTAVEDVANGNYNKKLYIDSNDELSKLANSFNTMARELKYTVAQLKDKNLKLEAILNSMTTGIIAVDNDYNIMMVNHLSYEFLNLENNKSLYEVIRNSHIFELIDSSFKKYKCVTTELDYNKRILRISANPILAESDKLETKGIVLIIEDVTQIRKLENMRRDFVSNVTHELKTPLTSIRGFVDTLKDGAIEDTENALRFLDIISNETDRLYKLIQEILTLSEIESRNCDLNMTKVSVYNLTKTLNEILQPLAAQKSIKLKIGAEKGLTDLYCNRERIIQLLINLIGNSIKYTEEGKIEVNLFNKSNILNIIIKDTGIGIPKDSIPRLFERFYRVDKGRSRKIGGTGLGLAIVKHIVILYKGEIEVKSKLGKGSLFKVTLPIFYSSKFENNKI